MLTNSSARFHLLISTPNDCGRSRFSVLLQPHQGAETVRVAVDVSAAAVQDALDGIAVEQLH
jgi:hypothetical protein